MAAGNKVAEAFINVTLMLNALDQGGGRIPGRPGIPGPPGIPGGPGGQGGGRNIQAMSDRFLGLAIKLSVATAAVRGITTALEEYDIAASDGVVTTKELGDIAANAGQSFLLAIPGVNRFTMAMTDLIGAFDGSTMRQREAEAVAEKTLRLNQMLAEVTQSNAMAEAELNGTLQEQLELRNQLNRDKRFAAAAEAGVSGDNALRRAIDKEFDLRTQATAKRIDEESDAQQRKERQLQATIESMELRRVGRVADAQKVLIESAYRDALRTAKTDRERELIGRLRNEQLAGVKTSVDSIVQSAMLQELKQINRKTEKGPQVPVLP